MAKLNGPKRRNNVNKYLSDADKIKRKKTAEKRGIPKLYDLSLAINQRLIDLGENQEWLVDETQIGKATISAYCNAESLPNGKNLLELAQALQTTPDYLLGYTNTPTTDITVKAMCEKTGLSDGAIRELESYNDFDMVELLNYLIENGEFRGFMARFNNLLMYQAEYSKEESHPEKYHASQYDTAKYAVISYFDKLVDDVYTNKAVEYYNYRNSTAHEREERWARKRELKGEEQNGEHPGKTE